MSWYHCLTGSHRETSHWRFSFSKVRVKWAKYFELTNVLLLLCPYNCENSFIRTLNNVYLLFTMCGTPSNAQTLLCSTCYRKCQTLTAEALIFPNLVLCTHFCTRERWWPPPLVSLVSSSLTSKVWWEDCWGSIWKGLWVPQGLISQPRILTDPRIHKTEASSHKGHTSVISSEFLPRNTYLTNWHEGPSLKDCLPRLVEDKDKDFGREVI